MYPRALESSYSPAPAYTAAFDSSSTWSGTIGSWIRGGRCVISGGFVVRRCVLFVCDRLRILISITLRFIKCTIRISVRMVGVVFHCASAGFFIERVLGFGHLAFNLVCNAYGLCFNFFEDFRFS